MKLEDDTPELGEIVRPYPKLPPIRHILNRKRPVDADRDVDAVHQTITNATPPLVG